MTINSYTPTVFLILIKDSAVCSFFLLPDRCSNFQAGRIIETMQFA